MEELDELLDDDDELLLDELPSHLVSAILIEALAVASSYCAMSKKTMRSLLKRCDLPDMTKV